MNQPKGFGGKAEPSAPDSPPVESPEPAMSEQQDLISQAIEQSLALAAAGTAGDWNDARASAYAKGCDLAQEALRAAMAAGGGGNQHLHAIAQLASIADDLVQRLQLVEQRQEAATHA